MSKSNGVSTREFVMKTLYMVFQSISIVEVPWRVSVSPAKCRGWIDEDDGSELDCVVIADLDCSGKSRGCVDDNIRTI